ncbi:AAA family ATPase [Glaesserella parasuis]|uniref:AAA family ATPase n=1 Tax=Glaesserella parasuis TaxID=738 RepID=UPI001353BD87|nr:AAA family ATPase [Glaesserella parasuis]MWQ40524.1 AAA family ATPase [Glaesserella parasuis]MWQ63169.1 AAA family ATPase [Glaesserella parasuis]
MEKELIDIANELIEKTKESEKPKRVQVIYAFNGTGKTRLSKLFKDLVSPKGIARSKFERAKKEYHDFLEYLNNANTDNEEKYRELERKVEDKKLKMENEEKSIEEQPPSRECILYYNSSTEDLFFWNHLEEDEFEPKLKIQPNSFINWILAKTGEDDIISNFKNFTNSKLKVSFENQDFEINQQNKLIANEVSFLDNNDSVKISQGEERNFIWSIFYTLIQYVFDSLSNNYLNSPFKKLKYIFIDDPISSLDENSLISLAVELSTLIKKNNKHNINFVITTHSSLFYNILFNELDRNDNYLEYKGNENTLCYILELTKNNKYELKIAGDSPFSYHLYLKNEIQNAIKNDNIQKFHFHFIRQILEKLSTFLGYKNWEELIDSKHIQRILNLSSHAKHSGDESHKILSNDKEMLKNIIKEIDEKYHFKNFNG